MKKSLNYTSEDDDEHQKNQKGKLSLMPIFLTVFIDMIGIGIIIPIFAPMLLDINSNLVPAYYSLADRTLILGILMGVYPMAQFFGAPILGAISDRVGRKKILLLSLVGTVIGYALSAIGIMQGSITIIIIGRIIDGFTGGNISIAMSAIADVSDEKEKAKNFGIIGTAFGLGLILGPFIGGKLSDHSAVSWFNNSTPFWFAAILSIMNIIFVIWFFKETLKIRINSSISFLTGIRNIKKVFYMPNLNILFLVIFLLSFGFTFYTQFFSVYLIDKFSFNAVQIGNFFAYVGLWIAITQATLIGPISKRFASEKVLSFSMVLFGIILLFLLLPKEAYLLFFIVPFIAICQGIIRPNYTAMVSNLSDKKSQGEIMGINQSIQALAMSIPPIIAGVISGFHVAAPIFVASACTFLAWIVFVKFFNKKNRDVFHEE
ncbi:MAG: MFS transporter [Nanoarchaeota archaeon]|nr:MFS transporter [Nanoarchaeota archaeon]